MNPLEETYKETRASICAMMNCQFFHTKTPYVTKNVVWDDDEKEYRREIIWYCPICKPDYAKELNDANENRA